MPSQEEWIAIGGGAAVIIGGFFLYVNRPPQGVTVVNRGPSAATLSAEVQLANIFSRADTQRLALETNERISLATLATNERTQGKQLETSINITKVLADASTQRANIISEADRTRAQTQANHSIFQDLLSAIPVIGGFFH